MLKSKHDTESKQINCDPTVVPKIYPEILIQKEAIVSKNQNTESVRDSSFL